MPAGERLFVFALAVILGGLLNLRGDPGSAAGLVIKQDGGAADGQEGRAPASQKSGLLTEIGILPGFKRGERVPEDERNPYAARVAEQVKPAQSGTEAAKIIQVLESLQIRGIVRDGNGRVKRVLLGDIALNQGGELPQVLPAQVDQLYVSRVTDDEVEIAWRTESGRAVPDGRRLALKLDSRPKVEVILPGQPDVKDKEKLRALLVARPEEED